MLEGGARIEKAAVNFTHGRGSRLPGPATAARPELAGAAFEAVSLSLIVHPRNPYVPDHAHEPAALHGDAGGQAPVWWFGGGFDLTPYYGFDEDCVHWHRVRARRLRAARPRRLRTLQEECDAYFLLKHRGEPRGIGGSFFDDLAEPDFETVFAFVKQPRRALPRRLPADRRAPRRTRRTASASATSSSGGAGATSSST